MQKIPTEVQKDNNALDIRLVRTVTDCRHFQMVQQRVWMSDDIDLIPFHVAMTIAKNGGILLVARTADGPPELDRMVGMVIGWPGLVLRMADGSMVYKHCSHMTGVLPEWRSRDIGLRLKLAQREEILAQGVTDWITWTFDPLQHVNAVFNLHRLGTTSNIYMRNIYGEMRDEINAGLPTDRLQVDWRIRSQWVEDVLADKRDNSLWQVEADKMQILATQEWGDGLHQPLRPNTLELEGNPIAVPIPDSVDAIRKQSIALMIEWRLFMRTVFEEAFGAGYVIIDCVQFQNTGLKLGWHYILVPAYTIHYRLLKNNRDSK
ncbi:hypothetical protein [Beggiatoa leptomitoformis]|uniref:N-acetyltransferase domain-containing protein n=1 Tax=Beggiatoa leptomitoformis TaxID=288004 RepID=A0A2N9YHU3_9GAMM|nr:hypothetical protein [Beggiatoa leptomitoformis]AUI69786.1 hypothetical protein BLE401_14525 [Beggiatoa leptomitoformis]QGX03677.1 hypothetical protein AL038_18950 [Beggiatoa leptomitoformis]